MQCERIDELKSNLWLNDGRYCDRLVMLEIFIGLKLNDILILKK